MATASAINNTAIQGLLQLNVSSLGNNSTEVTSAYLAKLADIGNTLSADLSTTGSMYSQYVSSSNTTSFSGAFNALTSVASGNTSSAVGSYLSEADKTSDAAVASCLSSMDMSGLYGSFGLGDLQNSVSTLMGGANMQAVPTEQTTGASLPAPTMPAMPANAQPVAGEPVPVAGQPVASQTMPDFSSFMNNSMTQGIDPYGIAATYTNGTTAMNFDGFTAGTCQHDAAKSSNVSYADSLANANAMYQSGDFSGLYQAQPVNAQIKEAYNNFMNTYMKSMGMGEEEINSVMSFYSSSFDSYANALTSYNSSFASSVPNAYTNLNGVVEHVEAK